MSSLRQRRLALRLERDELRLRGAALRQRLLERGAALQPSIHLTEQVQAGSRWLRQNPAVPLAALAVVLVLKPRRVIGWAGTALWAWQAWKRARPLVQPLLGPLLDAWLAPSRPTAPAPPAAHPPAARPPAAHPPAEPR